MRQLLYFNKLYSSVCLIVCNSYFIYTKMNSQWQKPGGMFVNNDHVIHSTRGGCFDSKVKDILHMCQHQWSLCSCVKGKFHVLKNCLCNNAVAVIIMLAEPKLQKDMNKVLISSSYMFFKKIFATISGVLFIVWKSYK